MIRAEFNGKQITRNCSFFKQDNNSNRKNEDKYSNQRNFDFSIKIVVPQDKQNQSISISSNKNSATPMPMSTEIAEIAEIAITDRSPINCLLLFFEEKECTVQLVIQRCCLTDLKISLC